jgi:hypothetical protein
MPIVTQCTVPGCATLTLGPLCLEHDQPTTRVFVRGRPASAKRQGALFASASFADVLGREVRTASASRSAVLVRR